MRSKTGKSISDYSVNNTESNYVKSINRVLDFIEDNIEDELSLTSLSGVAKYSEYHFHRIFKDITLEPPGQYIRRIRIEKAAVQLVNNPFKSITQIAYDSGFSSSQFFSRVFKQNFGISPKEWRENKNFYNVITSELIREIPDDKGSIPESESENSSILNPLIKIRELQDKSIAYIRHMGDYMGSSLIYKDLFSRLLRLVDSRGYIHSDTKLMLIFNDFFGITKKNRQKAMLCVTVPHDAKINRDIVTIRIPGGKYAVAHFELPENRMIRAWKYMLGEWLPQSGYQLDDRYSFSSILNYPFIDQTGIVAFDLHIPVKHL